MDAEVLVLTGRLDPTADVVIEELNRRGVPLLRADLADLQVEARLDGARWVGWLRAAGRSIRLEDLRGAYYRRPTQPRVPAGVDPQLADWAATEIRWGLRGLLAALPRHRWVSWPPAVQAAEHKPWQLVEATTSGLSVPATLVTNDPAAAAAFTTRQPTLYKPFRGEPVHLDGNTRLVYATPVTPQECSSDTVRLAPIQLQARVDKRCDVRVTCVDDMMFAVSPQGPGGTVPLDWRVDHAALTWQPVVVPDDVCVGLCELLHRLGLRFAACDFAVDKAGCWWFLEANPVGQWAWDHPLQQAITVSLADALTQKARP